KFVDRAAKAAFDDMLSHFNMLDSSAGHIACASGRIVGEPSECSVATLQVGRSHSRQSRRLALGRRKIRRHAEDGAVDTMTLQLVPQRGSVPPIQQLGWRRRNQKLADLYWTPGRLQPTGRVK